MFLYSRNLGSNEGALGFNAFTVLVSRENSAFDAFKLISFCFERKERCK